MSGHAGRLLRYGLGAVATLAIVAPPAGAVDVVGYDGSAPFNCRIQNVGTGVAFPDPDADPFCVEYDKTHQNLSELGIVDFLANEPARVAAANDKCFYFQADHWRGSLDQSWEQTETYNWDGAYFFDKARGVAGAFAKNFTVNNSGFDPTAFPLFPDRYRPFFGYARGGLQLADSIPVDPRCVERARQSDPYYRPPPPRSAPKAKKKKKHCKRKGHRKHRHCRKYR